MTARRAAKASARMSTAATSSDAPPVSIDDPMFEGLSAVDARELLGYARRIYGYNEVGHAVWRRQTEARIRRRLVELEHGGRS